MYCPLIVAMWTMDLSVMYVIVSSRCKSNTNTLMQISVGKLRYVILNGMTSNCVSAGIWCVCAYREGHWRSVHIRLRRSACSIKMETAEATPSLRRLVAHCLPLWPEFVARSRHVGIVVDKMALGQVFSKYFDLPCQFVFHYPLHNH
jgi:hypothetical protein